ncbi:MAG: glycerate kinase type-2 family protein [Trueperaceae bacterium]
MKALLESAFRHALAETSPKHLVTQHLPDAKPSLILAFGKAAIPMLQGALEEFPDTPYLVTPPSYAATFVGHGEYLAGTHPVPSETSNNAAERALELASGLREKDSLLVLVSGGGSALWCAPWGITLEEKQTLTQALLRSGADIHELNTVRKHVSKIKGGRLAQITKAKVDALLLSDVVGDDPAVIASGPTVADPSTFTDALEVLERYSLDFPKVSEHFQKGVRGEIAESPKPNDPLFARVENKVIGSNRILLEAARSYLQHHGHNVTILSDCFEGEAKELARFHAATTQSISKYGEPFPQPVILLSGGEATVTVKGRGKGGRNQEFALWLLHFLQDSKVWALSAGSDGIDGNSTAAGAFITPDSWQRAKEKGLDITKFLENNDSNTFFRELGDTLETGTTQHNLNDFRAIAL